MPKWCCQTSAEVEENVDVEDDNNTSDDTYDHESLSKKPSKKGISDIGKMVNYN